jgi:hypothetical protein
MEQWKDLKNYKMSSLGFESKKYRARHQWLTLVIPDTWEAGDQEDHGSRLAWEDSS